MHPSGTRGKVIGIWGKISEALTGSVKALRHSAGCRGVGVALKRIREKVRRKIERRYNMSLEEMIEELNPVLRGWHNYHKAVDPQRKRIVALNYYVWDRLRGFLRRKYNDETRSCRRLRGGLLTKLGLYQFA